MSERTAVGISTETVITTRKRVSQFSEAWSRMKRSKSAMAGLIIMIILILIAIFADFLVDYQIDCVTPNLANRLQAPSREHLLGTDAFGRDMLARIIYGTRISLVVAFSSVTLSLIIGAMLGSIAGFYGGKIENIIMRITDVFAAIPNLLMAITIATALGQSIFSMIIAIGIAGVPALARIVRATVLTVKDQDFVEAGRALGGNNMQIIFFHLLPNCIAPIIVQSTLRVAGAILSTSSLCFLGIGIKPPTPEWGNMLAGGRDFLRTAQHITLYPGLAIVITILAINLMGDGLRDALDPKLRR